jgi:hypothetical protein
MRFHLSIRTWVYSLFALLLLTGLGAVVGFHRFELAVGQEMAREHDDAMAGQRLLLQLVERHQELRQLLSDAALPERPDERRRGGVQVTEVGRELRQTVQEVAGEMARRPGAPAPFLRVEPAVEGYVRELDAVGRLLAAAEPPSPAAAVLDRFRYQAVPASVTARRELAEWLAATNRELAATREQATRSARTLAFWMVALTFAGILVLLLFIYQVDEALIRPARLMQRLIQGVTAGDLSLRLPELKEDYLNRVAIACNRLIENLNGMSEESRRRLAQEKQVSQALVAAIPVPALVLNASGDLLLANSQARGLFVGGEGAERLELLLEAVRREKHTLRLGGQNYRLTMAEAGTATAGGTVSVVVLQPGPAPALTVAAARKPPEA